MRSNIGFITQSEFYNMQYKTDEILGFPDLKIVDDNVDVKGKRILSVGGGNGADLWFLTKNNEVYLLDGSETAVELARTHGVLTTVGDVSEPLSFENNYFDIVVLKDILEHIYNPLDLLYEAKRVLKDDGYIILSLPNHFYLPFRLRILGGGNLIWKSLMHNHKHDFEEWNYMHIRFFTWKGVKKMLKKTELKIEKSYWDFGTLAHYSDPEMYHRAFVMNGKKIVTKKQWLLYKILYPAYKVFNVIFPKKIRALIVSICPGLLCAGFYLKLTKK